MNGGGGGGGGWGGFHRSLGGVGRTFGLQHAAFGSDDPRARIKVTPGLVRRVLHYFAPYRGPAGMVLLTLGFVAGLNLVPPLLVRAILDQALPGRNLRLLTWLVLGLVILPLVTGLIGVLQNYWHVRISLGMMFDLRNELYGHLQRLSLRFYTNTRSGEILSRVNNDVGAVQGIVMGTFVGVCTNLLTVIATAIVLFVMDWRLALLACAIVPMFVLPTRRVGRIRHRLSRETQEKQSELLALMQDVLNTGGFLLMRLFGQADYEATRFRDSNREVLELQVRQAMAGRWLFMVVSVLAAAGPALIYWYGGRRIILHGEAAGGLSIGTIIAFVAYLAGLYRPAGQLSNIYVDVQGALAVFARVFEYLDIEPEVRDKPGAVKLPQVRGQIRFDGVTFAYQTEHRPALAQVSFEIAPGQLAALVGPSGSGKTTATYLIPRFYDPQAGRVCIDGHDLRDVSQESLAAQIGMVTQETFLFHTTVRENLLYARPNATEAELVAAAQAAHIHDFIMGLPEQYKTVVGERGVKLSGGERQRVSLARAIL